MEELTVEEIIKYAVVVQQDSFIFYRKAAKRLMGNDLKQFTDIMADTSADHLMQLKNLLSECFLEGEDISSMQDVDTGPFDEVLENCDIPVQATPLDLLRISYRREQRVKKTYDTVLGLPALNSRVCRVFSDLRDSTECHLTDIRSRLQKRSRV